MAAPTPAPRFDAEEKQILLFTGVAHGLTHFVELSYPTLAVVLAVETDLPLERVLGWSLAGYLLFGLGALPAGMAADRFGSKRLVVAGLLLAGAATTAAAFVSPGWPLALCLAGAGLGASAYHPAGMGLISRAISARGTALGINGIYGNVGIASAPLVTGLVAEALGWRWAFGVIGGVLMGAALVGAAMPFREPPPIDAPPVESGSARGAAPAAIAAFVLLCCTAMLGGFAYRGNTLALPAFFAEQVQALNFSVAVSIAMIVGVVGQYLGGRVADRFSLAWGYAAFHALSLPMLFLMGAAAGLPLLLVSSLYVFFALGMQPLENSLFAQLTPERWRSTAYGLKFILTFGVGSSAVLLVQGVGEASGLAAVYRVLAAVVTLLVALAVGLALLQTQRGARPSLVQSGYPGNSGDG